MGYILLLRLFCASSVLQATRNMKKYLRGLCLESYHAESVEAHKIILCIKQANIFGLNQF